MKQRRSARRLNNPVTLESDNPLCARTMLRGTMGRMSMVQAGDRIWIPVLSGPARSGEIIAVCGRDRGKPPYAVRFDGEDRVRLIVPGPGTRFGHRPIEDLEA